jgi:hypothetical protein
MAESAQSETLAGLPREAGVDVLRGSSRSRPVDRSRLGVYAAIGASLGTVPVPWLPDAFARRVRGALVHDVASRHGLSLTRDARDVLAEPSGPDGPRGLLSQAARFIGVRLALRLLTGFGPAAVVWPARHALGTYLLGHLFDRYLELSRTERAVRIDVEEARRVRLAVDGAVLRALTVVTAPVIDSPVIDDQRDGVDVFVDALLGIAAGLPAKGLRRIEAAFDELLAQAHG